MTIKEFFVSNLQPKFNPETHSETYAEEARANTTRSELHAAKLNIGSHSESLSETQTDSLISDVELKETNQEQKVSPKLKKIPIADFVPDGYKIKHFLGSGQTANVFLAEHEQFGNVALKLIRPEIKGIYDHTRMFTNEVYLTTRLRHPFVVNAYEGDPIEAKAFLAMEYCAGGTLDSYLIKHGQFDLQASYKMILQIAHALSFSHTRGILHRDVKPANVLLKANNDARLADFGTGVYIDKIPKDEKVGTAYYMAPEIFKGATASVQSDIYSLGVLAYELLTARRPFRGKTYNQVMQAHLSKLPPNPKHLRKDLDKTVAFAIMKAISGSANKRYKTVAEFKDAIEKAVKVNVSEKKEAPMVVGRKSRATGTITNGNMTTTSGEGQTLQVSPPEKQKTKSEDKPQGFIRRFFVKKKK